MKINSNVTEVIVSRKEHTAIRNMYICNYCVVDCVSFFFFFFFFYSSSTNKNDMLRKQKE